MPAATMDGAPSGRGRAGRPREFPTPWSMVHRIAHARDLADELDELPAQLGVVHLVVGAQEVEGLAPVDEEGLARLAPLELALEELVEEEGDRHIERLGHDEERAGGDPVGPLLVFLHLLGRQTDGVAELLLAQAEHGAAEPDAAADRTVDMLQD